MVRWSYGYRYLLAPQRGPSDLEAEESSGERGIGRSASPDEQTPLQHGGPPTNYSSRINSVPDFSVKEESSSAGTSPFLPSSPIIGANVPRTSNYEDIPSLYPSQATPVEPFYKRVARLFLCVWSGFLEFMNPPLWAMLVAFLIALFPALQHDLFFEEQSFLRGSIIYGIRACGDVAIPLVLVILGANIANDKISPEGQEELDSSISPRSNLTQRQTTIVLAVVIRMFVVPVIILV
jgi:predicted permease